MKKLIYCFDLDGTLCTNTDGSYELAKPYLDRIRIVNDLYRTQKDAIYSAKSLINEI